MNPLDRRAAEHAPHARVVPRRQRRLPFGVLALWVVIGRAPTAESAWTRARATDPAPAGSAAGAEAVQPASAEPETLEAQRIELLETLRREFQLTRTQVEAVARTFEESAVLGQGNPRISEHLISRDQCHRSAEREPLRPGHSACGMPYMVPLYDPRRHAAREATVCIDQFEFPGVPCEYPVVHVKAREAVQLCEAVGKRLCDAHEWEGACAGQLLPAAQEYAFGLVRRSMRAAHNRTREIVWAYGAHLDHALCATSSFKTPGCPGSGYGRCGSNTFPTGSFPQCVSPLGVYDLHGNVAEHMNLPLSPGELGSAGGHGSTEMKGSWFIFATTEAHLDDCRWRAPDWHSSRVMSPSSHANYHLGFRCCRDVTPPGLTH
jgi:formylglycine-generating enzyme